jgi:hypothetical protein
METRNAKIAGSLEERLTQFGSLGEHNRSAVKHLRNAPNQDWETVRFTVKKAFGREFSRALGAHDSFAIRGIRASFQQLAAGEFEPGDDLLAMLVLRGLPD